MITLAVAVGLAAALYLYLTRTFDYWQKRGVKHDRPWPLFGTNARNYLMQANVTNMALETYRKYPGERVVGFFKSSAPELVIRDPALATRILIKDFAYFRHRGFLPPSVKIEPLLKNQFFGEDDLWRLTRIRVTPAFSIGKLKAMFPLIVDLTKRLQNRIRKEISEKQAIDARDLLARFTTDIIGTIGFGVDSDSLNDDNSTFRQLGIKIVSPKFTTVLKTMLKNTMPTYFGYLKMFADIEAEVIEMVQAILQQRNFKPCGRNDFIDLLLECRKQGAVSGESIVEVNADGSPKKVSIEMDDEMIAAQCLLFFVAGFETTSAATSYTLHRLAHNPRVQRKAQEEIDRVLAKHENIPSYDAILEMTYLKWCLDESLRIIPPVGYLQRRCVRSYTFPDTKLTIDPGVIVKIPINAYQNDPEIFPEPREFRPERFDPAVLTAQQKMAYMPFGEGPRACTGERLGLMQSLAGLAAVLAQFSVAPAPGAPRDPDPVVKPKWRPAAQTFIGGLPLIFHERKIT